MDTTEIINSITQIAADFGLRLLYAVLIIFVGRWVVKLLLKIIKSALEKTTVEETVRIFVANLLSTLLMVIIFIAAINQLGIETTSIIAMLGAAGLAIGLALQGSLANFAAGILIVIFRPYKVGDYIEAGSAAGTVLDIQIFSTVLKTPDNKVVVVPNGTIMDSSIINYTGQETRRVDIVASCGYEDDIDKVKDILKDILNQDERILEEPEPRIAVSELADNSINFIVRPWVNSSDVLSVKYSILEQIKKRFDEFRKKRSNSITEKANLELEKRIFLQTVDFLWRSHLQYLEHLRQVVGLRGYGGKDPLQEFKREAFKLFEGLLNKIKIDLKIIKSLLNETFAAKKHLAASNLESIMLGYNYVIENLICPLPLTVKPLNKTKKHI